MKTIRKRLIIIQSSILHFFMPNSIKIQCLHVQFIFTPKIAVATMRQALATWSIC